MKLHRNIILWLVCPVFAGACKEKIEGVCIAESPLSRVLLDLEGVQTAYQPIRDAIKEKLVGDVQAQDVAHRVLYEVVHVFSRPNGLPLIEEVSDFFGEDAAEFIKIDNMVHSIGLNEDSALKLYYLKIVEYVLRFPEEKQMAVKKMFEEFTTVYYCLEKAEDSMPLAIISAGLFEYIFSRVKVGVSDSAFAEWLWLLEKYMEKRPEWKKICSLEDFTDQASALIIKLQNPDRVLAWDEAIAEAKEEMSFLY